jgi:hypothetical protein
MAYYGPIRHRDTLWALFRSGVSEIRFSANTYRILPDGNRYPSIQNCSAPLQVRATLRACIWRPGRATRLREFETEGVPSC